jgi:hypothetical protein
MQSMHDVDEATELFAWQNCLRNAMNSLTNEPNRPTNTLSHQANDQGLLQQQKQQ